MLSKIQNCFILLLCAGLGVTVPVQAHHTEQTMFEFPQPTMLVAQAKTEAEIAADIRASQKLLAKLGYYSGSATGQESANLTKAVKAYQKDKKLVVNLQLP